MRSNRLAVLFLILSPTTVASEPGPQLGKRLSAQEIQAMDRHVFPDGTGLPEGQGNAQQGAMTYAQKCAHCHGSKGAGGTAGELVGHSPLDGPHPDQSIGNYWPYASTLFDFIQRSMPLDAPGSLSANEIYSLCAYLLELNGVIRAGTTIDQKTLAEIGMPNRNGFISLWPEPSVNSKH